MVDVSVGEARSARAGDVAGWIEARQVGMEKLERATDRDVRRDEEETMRAFVLAAVMSAIACSSAKAQGTFCDDLWFARNKIYKSAGYCFKTNRAIQAFGNAGCQSDDVRGLPLSGRDRQQIDFIVRQEVQMGCRD